MDDEAVEHWNKRYSVSDQLPPVAMVLSRYRHLLPQTGVALDLACGLGSNALFLAEQGLETHAWDISSSAIAKLQRQSDEKNLGLAVAVRDVVDCPPEPLSFDVIVVSRFLDRALTPALHAAIRPGGVLFYQTFVVGNTGGPSNPDYLLTEGELLRLFRGMQVRAFEDAGKCGRVAEGFRNESYIVVQKPAVEKSQALQSDSHPKSADSPRSTDTSGAEKSMSQIETFEAMLARGQDSEMLRLTLGNAYWKEKNFGKAIEHLQFALEKNPQYSAAWKVLGRVFADADQPEKAREAFESGLEVANNNGDKQTVKEMTVFLRRVNKTLNPPTDAD